MEIAVVVLSGANREFDKQYHYSVPPVMAEKLLPGMRVIVPFGSGNRSREGYVIDFSERSDYTDLKSILKIVDKVPVLKESLIKLVLWMKVRYSCTYGAAIKCMLPAGIGVKSLRIVRLVKNEEVLNREGFSGSTGKPSKGNQAIIDALLKNDNVLEYQELKSIAGIKSNFAFHIRELESAGFIGVIEQYSAAVKEKTVRVAGLALPAAEVQEDIENGSLKRIQQIRVLEILLENEYISVADIVRFTAVSPSVLDTLRKRGYIYYRNMEVKRDPFRHRDVPATEPLRLTPEQSAAFNVACELADAGAFNEMLLFGVTGSGKTEVYLQLIQHVLNQGKQAIVLVPEISLTPQMVDRFRGRFGGRVAVLHSRLSPGERYDQWRLIRSGNADVVVGARSAVFAPVERIGVIIIDEEHETSYKSETVPKYSAAQIAARRCTNERALLLYGSATPSVVTYHRAMQGSMKIAAMKERPNTILMPTVELVDMRRELESGNRTIFSKRLAGEITENIAKKHQTMLFLNRRGYASFILCRNCGIRIRCKYCNITMTFHAGENRLICHYCGYTVKQPTACPNCGDSAIRQFGIGTQRVEEDLKRYFPGCSVIRMDMDTTTGKHSHEEILDSFRNDRIDILVGTQMIAKGHDFPNVTLVGVLAADSLLGIDDYRASERTFQLLTQVSGRAGRGYLPGRVVIQTYNTEDYSITSACRYAYDSFYRQEIDIRRRLKYPPFTNILCLVISSVNDRLAFEKAGEMNSFVGERIVPEEGDELLPGPVRAPISRLRGRHRWRLVVKCSSLTRAVHMLTAAQDKFYGSGKRYDAELSVDINPVNMM